MDESVKSSLLPRLLYEKKIRKYMFPVLLILALAAFLSTTAVLSRNAEALTRENVVLDCHYHVQTGEGYAGYAVHVHNEDCYDMAGELVCKLPEIPAHVHDDSCWSTEQVLICTLEESDGHAHDESCYGPVHGEPICGLEEADAHAHDESCYGPVRGALTCGLEEEDAHAHDENCYTLVRGELICGLEEDEEHRHTDDCYEWTEKLTCGLEETEGHVHSDDCYEWNEGLICGLEETEGHAHSDDCYEWNEGLICGLEEGAGHRHDEGCYEAVTKLTCGQQELHIHTPACYDGTGALICGQLQLEEHIHGAGCFVEVETEEKPDPTADVESYGDYAARFYNMDKSGPWGEVLVAVAKTQLGYAESERNYIIDENGARKGYTRYGDWYGLPYGDWCAMFVSFCLHFAEIPTDAMPIECGVNRWVDDLKAKDLYADAASYTPKMGDIIFFDFDFDARGDHVGIVTAVDEVAGTLMTIEGNRTSAVGQFSFALSDPTILGYGVLPKRLTAEGPATGDENETDGPAADATGAEPALASITAADGSPLPEDVKLRAYTLNGKEAESARLEVETFLTTPVLPRPRKALRTQAAAPAAMENAASSETRYEVFEIGLDNVEETAFEGGFRVSVTLPAALTGRGFALYHLGADGVEALEAEYESVLNEDGTETVTGFCFVTNSFSPFVLRYTVDFYHEGENGDTYDFSMPGGGFITLRELARALHLAEDDPETEADELQAFVDAVESVSFSAPELIWTGRAEERSTLGALEAAEGLNIAYSGELTGDEIAALQKTRISAGEWLLISLHPFDTAETLTVTLTDGRAYTLAVTDARLVAHYISDSGERYEISVTYSEDAQIPDSAVLVVREILPEGASGLYERYVSKTENALGMENGTAGYIRLFDISIVDQLDPSIKYQPAAGTAVDVRIELTDAEDGKPLSVVHFADENDAGSVVKTEADGQTVSFAATGFSVYSVSEGTDVKRLAYLFYNDGSVVASEYVTQGMHLYTVGTVKAEYGQTFIGWAYSANETDPSKIYGDVNALDSHLQATDWSSSALGSVVGASGWDTLVLDGGKAKSVPIYAIFKDAFYLRYMNVDDFDNVFVLKTESVQKDANNAGRTIAFDPPEVSISGNSSQTVTEWIDVATGDVYNKQTDTTITLNQHVDLYPKFEGMYWLVFNANAGGPGSGVTYTPPQLLRGDTAVTVKPSNPVRKGYSFQGWYTNAAGTGDPFTFGTTLSADQVLYAKWTPDNTDYYVAFWRQRASDDAGLADSEKKYDYIESDHRTALTDSTVSLTTEDKTKNTGEYEHCTFNADSSQTTTTVNADGTTVLNVYYDREEFTLTFQVPDSFSSTTQSYNNNPNQYGYDNGEYFPIFYNNNRWYKTKNGNTYSDRYTGTRYAEGGSWKTIKTITALYDHSIADQFPVMWNGVRRWLDHNGSYYATDRVLVSIDRMPAADVEFHWSHPANRPTKTMNYYVEALSGETDAYANSIYAAYPYHHKEDVSTTDTTRSYTYSSSTRSFAIYNQIKSRYNMVTELEDFIEITGFTRWTSDPAYVSGVALNDSSKDETIDMYYTRNQYELIFVSNVPNSSEPRQEHPVDVYFEASLSPYGKQTDGSWYYVPTNGLEGYSFEGWYEDEALTKPYTFDGSMPADPVTVFAKWEPQRVRVVLVPTPNNLHNDEVMFANEQALTFRLDYKEKVNDANITGTAAKRLGYRLEGWYTTPEFKPGSEWNFETEVYSNVVQTVDGAAFYPVKMDYQNTTDWSNNTYKDNPDKKGVVRSEVKGILRLYAKWVLDIDTNSVYVDYEVPELYRVYDEIGNLQTVIPVDDETYIVDNGKITATIEQAPSDYDISFRFVGWQLLDAAGNPVEGKVYEPGDAREIPQEYFAEKEMTDDNGDPVLDSNGDPVVMKYVKLRAKFQPFSAEEVVTKIVFDGNGGLTADTHLTSYSENHQVNADVLVTPASDAFKWEGHKLVGWAFDPTLTAAEFETIIGGGTVAGKESETKNDVFRPNVTVFADNNDKSSLNTRNNTLYAVWETETYTVTVIKKVVTGEDEGQSYTFTATATGSDYVLSAGDASFLLHDGGTKVFNNVPYGTVLTFNETPATGYSIRSVDAKQTSLPDKTALDEAHYIDLGGADGKSYSIAGNTVITYTNEKTKDQKLRIRKIGDDAADGLAGATFSLTATSGQAFSDLTNLVSLDGAGDAAKLGYLPGNVASDTTLFVLPLGSYTLSETDAPAWYDGLLGGVTLTVTAEGVTVTKDNAADEVVLSGPVSGIYTLTVTNTRKLATVAIVKNVVGIAADQERTYAFSQTGLTGGAATFTLRGSDDAATSTVEENRTVFENIPYGTVFLITEDPYAEFAPSITISNVATPVTARSTGNVTVDGDLTITYVNTRNQQLVSVWKTDLDHNTLTGASFALYKAEDYNDSTGRPRDGVTPVVPSAAVNSDGILSLGNLAVGEYRLVETQAPAGVNPAEAAIKIYVYPDSVTAIQGTGLAEVARNIEGNAYRQYWVTGQDDATWQLRVWNNSGAVLPSTGGPGAKQIYLLGLILTAVSCAGLMLRLKRKTVQDGTGEQNATFTKSWGRKQ